MNQKQLMKTTFRGRKVDRPLFIPFIGNYITRVSQTSLEELYKDPSLLYQSLRDTQQLLNLDAVVLPIDQTLEAEAFGCQVEWNDGQSPTIVKGEQYTLTIDSEEWLKQGRIPVVLEAVKRFSQVEGKSLPILASISGPFTIADQIFYDEATFDVNEVVPYLIALCKAYANMGVDGIVINERNMKEFASNNLENALKPIINVIKHFNIYSILRLPDQQTPELNGIRTNGLISSTDYNLISQQKGSIGIPLTCENLRNVSNSKEVIEGFSSNFNNKVFITTNKPLDQEDIELEILQESIEAICNTNSYIS